MKNIRSKIKVFAFLVVIFLTQFANASHLVGGFLTYRWLGSNGSITQYRVNMYAYRDCSKDGTDDERPFDKVITLCVYNSDKSLYNSYDVNLLSKKKVNPVGNVPATIFHPVAIPEKAMVDEKALPTTACNI